MGSYLPYIIIAVLAIAAAIWFFTRKKDGESKPELPVEEEAPQKKLPKPAAEQKPKKSEEAPTKAKGADTAPKKEEPKPSPAAKEAKAKDTEKPKDKEAAKAKPEVAPAPAKDEAEEEEEPEELEPAAKAPVESKPRIPPVPLAKRPRDVEGLRKGLAKTREREGFFGKLKALFAGKKEIDPQIAEQMEEVLLTSDVGVKTTQALVGAIKERLDKGELKDEAKVWEALRNEAQKILGIGGGSLVLSAKPTVVMVVGVNGVGKTTTIGKLATRLVQQNKKVVLAAGDTFRAAAVQQLIVWGKRAGCEVVTGAEGANAGAVIFDAIQKAKEIGADVVLADTAGRLHTKSNLMDELKKIARTLGKAADGAPHETLLVLDATNGQNATQQAALFKEALPLSGIVLTKLDGTAKGGVILGICAEHQVPVRYIGIGERSEDLRDFDAEEFVQALLGQNAEATDKAA